MHARNSRETLGSLRTQPQAATHPPPDITQKREHDTQQLGGISVGGGYLDGEESEDLRANAGDDVVADGERAVGVGLPHFHELLPKLLTHLHVQGSSESMKGAMVRRSANSRK